MDFLSKIVTCCGSRDFHTSERNRISKDNDVSIMEYEK